MTFKVKLRTLIGAVLTVLAFFSLPLIAVWKKSKVVDMSETNAMLQQDVIKLENQNLILRFHANQLCSRSRIEDVAKNELGLDYPKNEDVTVLVRYSVKAEKKKGISGILDGLAAITK
ncbi:MAG: cell division protein FtsL [Fibrobacteres bacterium]|nr:cell division protein FtsL [Fibrobacterota bacterium]